MIKRRGFIKGLFGAVGVAAAAPVVAKLPAIEAPVSDAMIRKKTIHDLLVEAAERMAKPPVLTHFVNPEAVHSEVFMRYREEMVKSSMEVFNTRLEDDIHIAITSDNPPR